jgi:DNA (cytosine-5)-methyltransferase 1
MGGGSEKGTRVPKHMKTAVSLFSGCGGSDAGVLSAGFNILMANDILPYAKNVYETNHPTTDYILGSIDKITTFPKANLLIGCYPCQGFSQGGVRDPSRKINTLYIEFARALNSIKPRAFIVENVSGMVRNNFQHLLQDQIKIFTEAGYKVKAEVLNAADFGVAQQRKRIFIVGIRNDFQQEYKFPIPTHGVNRENPIVTIREALHNMPLWPVNEYYDREFHWYYMSRDRRRDWDEVSKTIVANPRHMPLHPISPKLEKLEHNVWRFSSDSAARRFSFREAAVLQGFPRDFRFPDTQNASLDMRYKVAGNAVPPPLFSAVTKAIPVEIWEH